VIDVPFNDRDLFDHVTQNGSTEQRVTVKKFV